MKNQTPAVSIERDAATGLWVAWLPGTAGAHTQAGSQTELQFNLQEVIAMLREDNALDTPPPIIDLPAGPLWDALEVAAVPYTLHAHAPSVTIADADANLEFPVEQLLKTIAFRVKGGGWLLAGICGYHQIDYKQLAEAVGVNRTHLMRLEPHEVESELGYPIGGVAPFAPNAQTRVLLDAGALRHATVFCGTGRRDRTLEIAPADLARVAQAQIAPLAKKPVCEG